MSRSGYTDECDETVGLWRQAVRCAIKGKRGQSFLKELGAALDAMPEKVLAVGTLISPTGEVCALGAVGVARGIKMEPREYEEFTADEMSKLFGISTAMAAEIMYMNDDAGEDWWNDSHRDTPDKRWHRVRNWVANQLIDR